MSYTVVGVDGCRAGWVAVVERSRVPVYAPIFESFHDLMENFPDAAVIAVDIPIGLPDRGARECDLEARRRLALRASSVFPAPLRSVLDAASHADASQIRFQIEGKRMSCQAFGIVKKIREVDRTLIENSAARGKVVEVHPEVSFAMWQGRPMQNPKRRKAGRAERRDLIRGEWPEALERCEASLDRSKSKLDDLYDAFAALWSARRVASGAAVQLPENAPTDACNLPMRIVA